MVNFDDPIQGTFDNCTFIAALCSAMWSTPKRLLQTTFNPATCNTNAYLVKFTGGVNVYVDNAPLAGGATSNNPSEKWPSLYEKGYAAFLRKITNNCGNPVSNVTSPIPWVATIQALEDITGLKRDPPNPVYTSSISNSATLLGNLVGLTNAYSVMIQPTLGWVKSTTLSPAPATSCFNANPRLVASPNGHTYSILGVYPNKSTPTDIVLRDPRGGTIIGSQIGPWKPYRTDIALNTNGIFTITPKKFLDCFNYYHSVK